MKISSLLSVFLTIGISTYSIAAEKMNSNQLTLTGAKAIQIIKDASLAGIKPLSITQQKKNSWLQINAVYDFSLKRTIQLCNSCELEFERNSEKNMLNILNEIYPETSWAANESSAMWTISARVKRSGKIIVQPESEIKSYVDNIIGREMEKSKIVYSVSDGAAGSTFLEYRVDVKCSITVVAKERTEDSPPEVKSSSSVICVLKVPPIGDSGFKE